MMPALPQRFLFDPLAGRPQPHEGIWLDRHWHAESTPAWSRGRVASLAVSAAHFPLPVPLVLRLCVFGASSQTPRELTVTSPGQKTQQLQVRTSEPISVLTATPAHVEGATHSALELGLDGLTSPARVGLSSDERLLGLRIVSLRPEASPPSWPVDFTTPTPAAAATLLQEGWAPPEPDAGAWSLGARSDLLLPGYMRPKGITGLAFHAVILARPGDSTALEVRVAAGGAEGPWQQLATSPVRLDCPVPDWQDNTDYPVTLQLRHVLSPRDLGINTDTRPLGLLLRRIEPDQDTIQSQADAAKED